MPRKQRTATEAAALSLTAGGPIALSATAQATFDEITGQCGGLHMPRMTYSPKLAPRMHDLCRAVEALTEKRGIPPSMTAVIHAPLAARCRRATPPPSGGESTTA